MGAAVPRAPQWEGTRYASSPGRILGGEQRVAAPLSQTRRWRAGEVEGPGQADKDRAEMEPVAPGPLWLDAAMCQYPGVLGGWGWAGRGEPPGIPLGLVLVPAGSASLCGPELPEDKTACGQRTCPPSDPSTGQGPCGMPGLRGGACL